MRIAFGTDESTPVTDHIERWLEGAGHTLVLRVVDRPWPEVGRTVGEQVAGGSALIDRSLAPGDGDGDLGGHVGSSGWDGVISPQVAAMKA